MLQEQEKFKKMVKNWLKNVVGENRYWLARLCGVNKRTVDNWLSSNRPIPLRAKMLIYGKMRLWEENKARDRREQEKKDDQSAAWSLSPGSMLSIAFSRKEITRLSRQAKEEKVSVNTWAKQAILSKLRESPRMVEH